MLLPSEREKKNPGADCNARNMAVALRSTFKKATHSNWGETARVRRSGKKHSHIHINILLWPFRECIYIERARARAKIR